MRVLITGGSGFAGEHLTRACLAGADEVASASRSGAAAGGARPLRLDLADGAAIRSTVAELGPELIYHLAALSSVGRSWVEPAETMRTNVGSAVNLLEAVRLEAPAARVVWVSSCEVYGTPDALPVPESAPLRPASPYAVSKAAGEQLAEVYAEAYGLDVVRARPFSHTGPGQKPMFLAAGLARRAAAARLAGARSLPVPTGNPDTRRDFTDVRDVVAAYRLLGAGERSGAYNVSSGRSVSTAELVALVGELVAPLPVDHVVDPALVRSHEISDLSGDNHRLRAELGWEPVISLRETLAEMITWWEERLKQSSNADG